MKKNTIEQVNQMKETSIESEYETEVEHAKLKKQKK